VKITIWIAAEHSLPWWQIWKKWSERSDCK